VTCLRPVALALTLALVVIGGAAGTSRALPLSVRAPTALEVALERDGGGTRLLVRLSELDGPGLGLRPLEVEIAIDGAPPKRQTLLTDAAGRGTIPLGGGIARYSVRFRGGERHAPQEARGELNLGRPPSRLVIDSEAEDFGLRTASVVVAIRLHLATPAFPAVADAPLRVRVDDGPVQAARTGPEGVLQLVLSPRLAPSGAAPARPVEVRVSFEGSDALGPSEAVRTFPRALLTRVTLRAGHEEAGGGRLRFSGRVSHELGGWAGAPVRVAVRGVKSPIQYDIPAIADSDGIWNATLPLARLHAEGGREVEVAAFVPAEAGYEGAESEVLRLEVPAPSGRSAGPALALVAGILGIALGARRFVQHLKARRASSRSPGGRHGGVGGLRAASDGSGRPEVLRLAFVDADTARPLNVSAQVWLEETDGTHHAVAEVVGADAIEVRSNGRAGRWRVEVRGAGLMPTRLELACPHDGSGDGLQVRVERVARRVRRVFEGEMRRLGVATDWGRKTPREASQEAASRTAPAPLRLTEVTDAVEQAYFGPRSPSAEDVARLEREGSP
jgi:hypothetical protein